MPDSTRNTWDWIAYCVGQVFVIWGVLSRGTEGGGMILTGILISTVVFAGRQPKPQK